MSKKNCKQQHKKEEGITVTGRVIQALPNATFRVELENGHVVLGHLRGIMQKKHIHVLPDDIVHIELSPYDLNRGRITYREK